MSMVLNMFQRRVVKNADFISLNAPYTPETHKMIGEKG